MVETLQVRQTGRHSHGEGEPNPAVRVPAGEGRKPLESWPAIRRALAALIG